MDLFDAIRQRLEEVYNPPSETPVYIREKGSEKEFGEDVENELIRLINLNFGSRLVNLNDVLPNFPGYDIYDLDGQVKVGSAKAKRVSTKGQYAAPKPTRAGVPRTIQCTVVQPSLQLCPDGILLYVEVEFGSIMDLVVCKLSKMDTPLMKSSISIPKLMKVGGVRVIENGRHHWQRFTSFAKQDNSPEETN